MPMLEHFSTDKLSEYLPKSQQGGDPSDIAASRTASLFVNGTAVAAGLATKVALESMWRFVRRDEPPTNPAAAGVTWTDAITWAAAVGAAMGVSRALTRRGATAAWRKVR